MKVTAQLGGWGDMIISQQPRRADIFYYYIGDINSSWNWNYIAALSLVNPLLLLPCEPLHLPIPWLGSVHPVLASTMLTYCRNKTTTFLKWHKTQGLLNSVLFFIVLCYFHGNERWREYNAHCSAAYLTLTPPARRWCAYMQQAAVLNLGSLKTQGGMQECKQTDIRSLTFEKRPKVVLLFFPFLGLKQIYIYVGFCSFLHWFPKYVQEPVNDENQWYRI